MVLLHFDNRIKVYSDNKNYDCQGAKAPLPTWLKFNSFV